MRGRFSSGILLVLAALLALPGGGASGPTTGTVATSPHVELGTSDVGTLGWGVRAGPPSINISGNGHSVISTSQTVGNITVSGNASLFVQGTPPITLTVEGMITLRQNASLVINRSGLVIPQTYAWQYPLQTFDNSTLRLNHTTVNTGGYILLAHFFGDSNTSIVNCTVKAPNWFGAFIAYGAAFNVANSTLGGDIQLDTSPGMPNAAHVRMVHSSGFDVLTSFPAGARANVTLPSVDPAAGYTWVNWTFPGSSSVSGVGYTISLVGDQIWHMGAYLWGGSDVTLTNATNLDLAFFLWGQSATFSGFRDQHYSALRFASPIFHLDLYNITILQMTWYPEHGSFAGLSNDDIGQVIPQLGSNAFVTNSNYTGMAGPLSTVDDSGITIENSSIYGLVQSEATSNILVENCSLHLGTLNPKPIAAEADDQSSILLRDSSIAAGLSLEAQQQGTVVVSNSVNVSVALPGGAPASGATVAADWWPNGTEAQSATTDPAGMVLLELTQEVATASGVVWLENYTLVATEGPDTGSVQVRASQVLAATIALAGPIVITSFSATPAALVLGAWTNLSVEAVGSFGDLEYAYTGLPTGCVGSELSVLPCHPTAAGDFLVRAYVNDTTGDSGTATTFLNVTLPRVPITIATFGAAPATLLTGERTNLTVDATGGTGALNENYTGLPPGCVSSDTAVLACRPTAPGTFTVRVYVNDSSGDNATTTTELLVTQLAAVTITVAVSPSSASVVAGGTVGPFAATVACTPSCPGSGITYLWSLDPSSLGTLTSPSAPSTNFTAASAAGTVALAVNVSFDGTTVASAPVPIVISRAGTGGASSPTLLGLPVDEAYSVLAGVVIALVAIALVVRLTSGPRTPKDGGADHEGSPPSANRSEAPTPTDGPSPEGAEPAPPSEAPQG